MSRREGPKKPRSSFNFFVTESRKKIKKENSDMNFREVTKEVSKRWKEIKEKEKKKYIKMATEDKKRYEKEKEKWEKEKSSSESEPEITTRTRFNGKKVPRFSEPKRPRSAYHFFSMEERPKLKNKFPSDSSSKITKKLGKKWKALKDSEAKKFTKKADADKKRWKKEFEEYQKARFGSSSEESSSD
ncbi:high mobility group protein dsp1 [Anaeramoeba flamelloides]|uniref:High mobility group protein dsp1 n=1 Tax=Anaeramoeba flamelloides TaxID=1746091 RepID=A0AAV8A3B5_9EUKA|nr:high mobility group protein dsp1 [Anaeramoeba flamelloides]KAJ6243566.1 high mobility group protein dsp1 [Anaeramoeba flamelloides]